MAERRRGAVLEDALLEAAWAELTENGYANFTLDAVAQRAGTSRPVLYRRWPDRHELVRAAIAHARAGSRVEIPDTGSLRGDLLAFLREANANRVEVATVVGIHLAGYYQETGTSPADLREILLAGQGNAVDVIYERAVERGEVRPGVLTDRLKALPFDLLRQEVLMTFASVPDAVLEEIVDTIFLPLVLARGGVSQG